MTDILQGEVYKCEFGIQRGIELAGCRPALIVSHDQHNKSGANVLVMPATRGYIKEEHSSFYVPLEQIDTRVSFRNLKTVRKESLGRFKCLATKDQLRAAITKGIGRYLARYSRYLPEYGPGIAHPGEIHQGFIPNHAGGEERQKFLIITSNTTNDFALVAKVDDKPVGKSEVRIPLDTVQGPAGLAAHCHQIQPVDLAYSLLSDNSGSYIGNVHHASLRRVIRKIISIIRPPPCPTRSSPIRDRQRAINGIALPRITLHTYGCMPPAWRMNISSSQFGMGKRLGIVKPPGWGTRRLYDAAESGSAASGHHCQPKSVAAAPRP